MLELLEARTAALYRLDPAGDLLAGNTYPEGRPPPTVAITLGRERTLLKFAADFPHARRSAVADAVARMLRRDFAISEIPAGIVEALRLLVAVGGKVAEQHQGPLFAFPDPLPASDALPVPGPACLRRLFPEADDAGMRAHLPCRVVLDGNDAVSSCYSARRAPQVHEAGVDTLPEYRRRGLGARVCAAWAADVRGLGAVPVYSTSFENLASCALARHLGLVRLATDLHFTVRP